MLKGLLYRKLKGMTEEQYRLEEELSHVEPDNGD